jgi:hypothetical protein
MSSTLSVGAAALVPAAPIIPIEGSFANPLSHCNLKQVKSLLMGLDLSPFRGDDGTLNDFYDAIESVFIPEASKRAVGKMRTNYDYTRETWYFDGNGTDTLILPRREIVFVNAVFLRVIPSLQWYRFTRIRKIDGSEFPRIGGVEPPPAAPESIPPNIPNPVVTQPTVFTGAEDADLMLDPRRRMLKIPPRILYANFGSPLWNYNFFQGPMNVEVHFVYGHAPTKYTDGTPLIFDPTTGIMQETSPSKGDGSGNAPVDWSSGMPAALSMAVARLVYADIMRRLWRGVSGGLSSMSVDGASESYGSSAFGGDADKEEQRAMRELEPFTIRML